MLYLRISGIYIILLSLILFTGCENPSSVTPPPVEIGSEIDPEEEKELILGGPGTEELVCICKTDDGGYAMGGYSTSTIGGDRDALMFKIDDEGTYEWNNSYGSSDNDEIFDIMAYGNYLYMTGYLFEEGEYYSNIYYLIADKTGTLVNSFTYGESLDDYGVAVIYGFDENKYIVANTDNNVVSLMLLSSGGGPLWQYDYAEATVFDAEKTSDNGIAILAVSYDTSLIYNGMIIKVDMFGDSLWASEINSGVDDVLRDITVTEDGGFITTGSTDFTNTSDVYLVKISSTGELEWETSFGGTYNDDGYAVLQASDGGYVVAGRTEIEYESGYYQGYVVKTNATGEIEWERRIGDEYSGYFSAIEHANTEGYWLAGTKETESQSWNAWVMYILPDPPEEEEEE